MEEDVVTLKPAPKLEAECWMCPLADKKGRVCVGGYFPTERWNGLAFVGEQPWKEEARAGIPFVGQSGRLLWAICKSLGIPQAEVLVLNAISCFAGEWPAGSAEKTAKGEARRACRGKLLGVLEQWKPRVIVALGGEAIRSLLDDEGASVGGYRGTVNSFAGAWLTCAEHPAAILRSSGFTAPLLKKDLAKAWRWLIEGAPRVWESTVEAAPNLQRTRELCALWRAAGRVTGDVETVPDGGRWHDKLRLVGLGDEDRAAWWPMFGNEWPEFYSEQYWLEVRAELRALMADATVAKTFHNKQYDMAVLENHGFPVAGLVEDTMVMHHVLHLRDVAHDLGYVGAEYLDVPAWKKEFKKEWHAPIRTLGEYNGNDVLVTARVQPRMLAELTSRGLMATYVMDRDGTDVAYEMNRNGIWIDEYRRQQYLDEYDSKAAELMAQTLELTGAAARQKETLELVAGSDIERWAKVKLVNIEAGARPDVQAVIDVCELVAGRLLQPKIVDELEEGVRKLRALEKDATWRPWMPLDPAGPVNFKQFSAALKLDESGVKASAAYIVEVAKRDANAAARVAAGRACAVIRSAVARVQKALTKPLLNLESGQQVGQVLHSPKWLGLPVAKPADAAGEYLTNEEALYHVSWHPVVKAWQDWGSAAYRAGWLRDTLPISADGRAHGAFKTTRTPNARWAGGADGEVKWNPQNPEKATIDIFAAPPGHVLVGRDFSMIEIRVAAALSGDRRMIAQINEFDTGVSPWDIHQRRAIRCWPDFPSLEPEIQKKKRNLAKRANFGPIYGATKWMLLPVMLSQMKALPDLADNNRRTEELLAESQRILDDIHNDWAELFVWLEEGYRRALRDGTLKNGYISGRTVHFPVRDKDHVERRFCYNAPVQCTAREIVMAAMLRIDKRKDPRALWVMDAHDQLLIECPEELGEETSEIMKEEMHGRLGEVLILSDGGAAGGIARTWKELK